MDNDLGKGIQRAMLDLVFCATSTSGLENILHHQLAPPNATSDLRKSVLGSHCFENLTILGLAVKYNRTLSAQVLFNFYQKHQINPEFSALDSDAVTPLQYARAHGNRDTLRMYYIQKEFSDLIIESRIDTELILSNPSIVDRQRLPTDDQLDDYFNVDSSSIFSYTSTFQAPSSSADTTTDSSKPYDTSSHTPITSEISAPPSYGSLYTSHSPDINPSGSEVNVSDFYPSNPYADVDPPASRSSSKEKDDVEKAPKEREFSDPGPFQSKSLPNELGKFWIFSYPLLLLFVYFTSMSILSYDYNVIFYVIFGLIPCTLCCFMSFDECYYQTEDISIVPEEDSFSLSLIRPWDRLRKYLSFISIIALFGFGVWFSMSAAFSAPSPDSNEPSPAGRSIYYGIAIACAVLLFCVCCCTWLVTIADAPGLGSQYENWTPPGQVASISNNFYPPGSESIKTVFPVSSISLSRTKQSDSSITFFIKEYGNLKWSSPTGREPEGNTRYSYITNAVRFARRRANMSISSGDDIITDDIEALPS